MKMLLLVLILVLLVGWLFLRSRQEKVPVTRKTARRATSSTKKNYHAVSIKFEAYACAAAKELEGQRFLSNAAPRLPLPECNATDCKCHFAHHKDRRAGKDRRNVFTASGYSAETGKHEQERRQADDRRHDDDDDFIY
jgi:hypothetical protein